LTTAGQPLDVSIENTGSNCLNYGDDFIDWQRADAAGWTSIPQHGAISDVLHYLQPGETKRIEALRAPQTLTAGHYRLMATFRQGTPPNGPVVVASKEFNITS
jgi:hypothetical protein